ncbi:hypothetical protein L227DRAFT_615118 [Lentinus tigrinus ALCF2SS1-6]|uniref:Uncharacterized protein n=1 Tax=Lentinus tigrinus ALCF2SS1-6 TaxID=1328759 RepID=A0A5C2RXE5_9APHY|nr:hypothetical protein L227DRAFT_615118 [Lentinus tigrinus ALCF2SS1-6]
MASPSVPAHVFWGAKLELNLTAWRIIEAIKSLPRDADTMTLRRWNVGIVREIWVAIRAAGICYYMAIATPASTQGLAGQHDPIAVILKYCEWTDRDLKFNVAAVDVADLERELALPRAYFGTLAGEHGYPLWWTWNNEGPPEGPCPTWWKTPPDRVSPPYLIFENDMQ